MEIDIGINNLAGIAINEKLVKEAAATVIFGEAGNLPAGRDIEVSIAFIGPGEIREINKKYRKKDQATDVLSFAEDDCCDYNGADHPRFLGELAICAEVVKSDAVESGKKYEEELAWVVIHGILHLFGYDHETSKKDADSMRQKEKFYLSQIK